MVSLKWVLFVHNNIYFDRYGQLSGLVEIIAGILGVFFVQLASCLLPFTLSFAAGAMIFVVFNEIIPEITS